MIFTYILIATILDSLLGFVGKLLFWLKDSWLDKLLIYFIAFSAGALLGGAFFHLLPEGLESMNPEMVFTITLVGFLFFVIIEGYFHWHQCEKCKAHPFSYVMLVGDGIHNFIDGLIIAAAFLIDVRLGIITTIMVIIHELPQELGLFGSLIYAGHKKNNALIYSFFAQSTVIIGGIIGFFLSRQIEILSGFLISFAAGGFLYIAASDLVPEVHKSYKGNIKRSVSLIFSLLFGMALMYFLKIFGE
jgi:zinc and cadmium transporter